jgi:hypothetical protein
MYTALTIGIVGLIVWYVCLRLEQGSDAGDVFFARQHRAREEMSRAERAAQRHEQSAAHRYVSWFKSVGMGLSTIGFGGALVLGLVAFAL